MKLKVKEINLSTGGPLIAVLNEKTAKKISLFPKERIHIKKIRAKPEKYYTRTRLVRQTLKRKAVKIGYKNRDILAIYDKGTRQLITVLFNRGLKHYQLKKHRWNKSG